MVYMDFEALMKNSLPLWVYCVCTNCWDSAHHGCPSPDRLLQDVAMENKKNRRARDAEGKIIGSEVVM